MKKKACRRCKYLYEGVKCPACKSDQGSTNWEGRVSILEPDHSEISKKIKITVKGEYAIKVR
ncbi:MAG: DNA-directed RNA polymerase subunit E'' [Nanoarchaeota archaeon]|nr:DNA-directed RNA polymerase subunit E'' [Nanoarchaeota archaeon]